MREKDISLPLPDREWLVILDRDATIISSREIAYGCFEESFEKVISETYPLSEKLSLEVWTDGTISPEDAVSQAAIILINQFSPFRDLEVGVARGKESSALMEQYNTPLEGLGLSLRSYNSLKRASISTLGELLERSTGGLPQLPGLGAKSRQEVETVLANLGFPIPSEKKK